MTKYTENYCLKCEQDTAHTLDGKCTCCLDELEATESPTPSGQTEFDLLSCPFCGGTDLEKLMSGGRNIAANTYCKNKDCPICCVSMSKKQWQNRAI